MADADKPIRPSAQGDKIRADINLSPELRGKLAGIVDDLVAHNMPNAADKLLQAITSDERAVARGGKPLAVANALVADMDYTHTINQKISELADNKGAVKTLKAQSAAIAEATRPAPEKGKLDRVVEVAGMLPENIIKFGKNIVDGLFNPGNPAQLPYSASAPRTASQPAFKPDYTPNPNGNAEFELQQAISTAVEAGVVKPPLRTPSADIANTLEVKR